jgi:predicted MFS family arabinose efflux permease
VAVASLSSGPAFAAPGLGAASGLVANVAAGARALRAAPGAILFVGADTLGSAAYGVHTVLLVAVASRLGLGADGYGVLLAGYGVGAVLGSSLAGRLADGPAARRLLAPSLVAIALPFVVLALTSSLVAALLSALVAGAGGIVVEVLAETALQRTLDQEAFGRAYGLALPVSLAGIVAGGLAAPILAQLFGLNGALLLCGTLIVVYAAAVGFRRNAPRSIAAAEVAATA